MPGTVRHDVGRSRLKSPVGAAVLFEHLSAVWLAMGHSGTEPASSSSTINAIPISSAEMFVRPSSATGSVDRMNDTPSITWKLAELPDWRFSAVDGEYPDGTTFEIGPATLNGILRHNNVPTGIAEHENRLGLFMASITGSHFALQNRGGLSAVGHESRRRQCREAARRPPWGDAGPGDDCPHSIHMTSGDRECLVRASVLYLFDVSGGA